jgi:hypothetical protein
MRPGRSPFYGVLLNMHRGLKIDSGLDDTRTLPDEDMLALLDLLDPQGKFVELGEPLFLMDACRPRGETHLKVKQVVSIRRCRGPVEAGHGDPHNMKRRS